MDFTSLLSSFGFPVVACVAVGWYVKYISDKSREQIDKILEDHKSEMKDVTAALNNNTMAIQRLTDFITKEGE